MCNLIARTGWEGVEFIGLCYFLFSMAAILVFSCFCMVFFRLILIELPKILFGMKEQAEEGLMYVCFFLGFVIGINGGCWIMLQIAIWLGFRYGDLPMLPTWN